MPESIKRDINVSTDMVNLSGLVNLVVVSSVTLCVLQTYQVSSFECGKVQLTRKLVLSGNETIRGEWPFIVALYKTPTKYICGGTLISNKHVLTAAHCIHRTFLPDDLKVKLGAYNITQTNETGSVERSVSEIIVHPDWNANSNEFDADVAILVLTENVTFSHYIQPVCMPPNDVRIDPATIDIDGTVVGWGLDENEFHEDIPQKFVAKPFKNTNCYRMDPGVVPASSYRTFCAKCEDATANEGDSGGGFFAVSVGSWVQYGIVSAIRPDTTGHAVINSFAIYTNVKLFKQWIVQSVRGSGGEVGESKTKVNLNCKFVKLGNFGYACQINDFYSLNENTEIVSVSGEHVFGNNDDVETIHFKGGYMPTLPNGIDNFFKNVANIKIGEYESSSSLRLRYIVRSSLQNLESLTRLRVYNTEIEVLDEDCLWDLPNLKDFLLTNNRLTELKDGFFDRNEKLVTVLLLKTRLETLPKNLFKRNVALKVLSLHDNSLVVVDGEIFKTNTKLKYVNLSSNKLEFLPINLFENQFLINTLVLNRNSIKFIDGQTFKENLKLLTIDLSSNQLKSLPPDLFKSNSLLEVLMLSANSIKAIDGRIFENNLKLQAINLSSNHLEFLPTILLENNLFLKIVDLSGNFLKSMDERYFENSSNLRAVYLFSNPIGVIHRNLLKDKSQLKSVELQNMSLMTIDEHFFESHLQLSVVDLSSNKLEFVPKNLFKNNLLLEVIDFSNNSLKKIDEETFQANSKLLAVDCSSNQLEKLPQNLFRNNLLLEVVVFDNNSIKAIDEEFFAANVNLQYVHLSSNRLENLPKNLFKNSPLLSHVFLDRNYLKAIDGQIFETNSQIVFLSFYSNQLETLPRDLFKNTLLLEEANFARNYLKIIETDLTKLKNVKVISFYENICINIYYSAENHIRNVLYTESLIGLQDMLNVLCNSANNSVA